MRDGTDIDDRTARYIASQLHEGQASALYSLTSTGAIAEEVHAELTRDFDRQPEHVKSWINWLGTYCLNRERKGPVTGWVENAAEQDRAELLGRINAAGVRTLGQVATIIGGRVDGEQGDAGTYFSAGTVAAITDADDVPTGQLAKLVAPCIVFSEDKHLRRPGLAPAKWREVAGAGVDLAESYGKQAAAVLPIALPARLATASVQHVSRKIGVAAWMLGGAAALAGAGPWR